MPSPVILNETFKPIPFGFKILVRITSSSTSADTDLTFYANNFLTKIKVESSDETINESTVDFEFAPSMDSYMSSEGSIPPWVFFESLGYVGYYYDIEAFYISKANYQVYTIAYNNETVKTQINQAITAYTTGLTGSAQRTAMKERIVALGNALRSIDDQIEQQARKLQVINLSKPVRLSSGNIHTNTYSGGEDGVIKYSFKIYDKITKKEAQIDQVANRNTRGSNQGFKIVSVYEMVDFFKKSVTLNEGTIKDFLMLLLGQHLVGIEYQAGTRVIAEPVTLQTYGLTQAFAVPIDNSGQSFLALRTSFKNDLDTRADLDLAYLETSTNKFLGYLAEVKGTVLGDNLDKAAGEGGFFSNVVKNLIRSAAANNGAAISSNISYNGTTLYTGFYNTIKAFKTDAERVDRSNIANYFELIRTYFGIKYKVDRTISGKDLFRFYITDLSKRPISVTSTDRGNITDLPVLDYGGLVIDFNYSIKTNNVSIKELAGGSVQITTTFDQGVTLQFEISKQKINKYASGDERTQVPFQQFVEKIRVESTADPDGFLNSFLDVVVDTNTRVSTPKIEPAGAKGSQLLSLKLRNPIPQIDKGSAIYFTTITDFKRDFKALPTGESLGQSVRSYILPKKITGVYLVTKVIHVLNAKENVWVQTLECER